jgi:hypothetical protein
MQLPSDSSFAASGDTNRLACAEAAEGTRRAYQALSGASPVTWVSPAAAAFEGRLSELKLACLTAVALCDGAHEAATALAVRRAAVPQLHTAKGWVGLP